MRRNRGVKNYMKEDHRSNNATFAVAKRESLKKNQAFTGFEPFDLCDTGAAL